MATLLLFEHSNSASIT